MSIWLAAPISLAFAALLGFLNLAMTVKIGIPALITTLGTLILYRSVAFVLMEGRFIPLPPDPFFRAVFGGRIWNIPMVFVWFVGVAVCFWILLEHTPYGNRVFATGGNPRGATMLGLNTSRVRMTNFLLVALFTGFAALCQFAFQGVISPMTGHSLPLEAIVIVVVGGTSLFGGSGTIVGTVLGTFMLAEIYTGLDVAQVDAYWKPVFVGVIFVVAVVVNRLYKG